MPILFSIEIEDITSHNFEIVTDRTPKLKTTKKDGTFPCYLEMSIEHQNFADDKQRANWQMRQII